MNYPTYPPTLESFAAAGAAAQQAINDLGAGIPAPVNPFGPAEFRVHNDSGRMVVEHVDCNGIAAVAFDPATPDLFQLVQDCLEHRCPSADGLPAQP